MRILPTSTNPVAPTTAAAGPVAATAGPLDQVTLGAGTDAPTKVSVEQALRIMQGDALRPEPAWTIRPPQGRFPCGPATGPAGLLAASTKPLAGGRVAMLDPATGFERWSADLERDPEWLLQGLDGTVYVGQRFGVMEARQGDTGELLWQSEVGHHLSGPPIDLGDGRIYGLKGGGLAAYNVLTGEKAWSNSGMLGLREKGPVDTGDGGVVVHADNGLFCFEGETGRERWHREDLKTLASARDGVLYAGGEKSLVVLDPKDGHTLREVELPSKPFTAPVPGPGDRVYVAVRGGQLVAVDGGKISWTSTVYTDFNSFITPVGQRLVLVGNSDMKSVFGVAADTGRRLWLEDGESPVAGKPALQDGVAYVANYGSLRRIQDDLKLVGPEIGPRPEIAVGEQTVTIGGVDLPRRAG